MGMATMDDIIRKGLLAVLGFSVVFFGAVHAWAYTCVQIFLLCLAVLFVLARIPAWHRSERGEISWIVTPVNLAAFVFLAVVVVQIIPLPGGLVKVISPNTAAVIDMSEGVVMGSVSTARFTLYRYATVRSLMMVLAILYFYFLFLYSIRGRSQLKASVKAVLYLGLAVCIYGLFEKLSGHGHILWWRHHMQARGFRVFGTFINPDHFAFFLNLILCLLFGHLYALMGRRERNRYHRARGLFRSFMENEPGTHEIVFLSFCFCVMVVTLIMTGSRAAIFSLALSMCVIFILLFVKTRKKSLFLFIGFLLLIVLVYGQRIGVEKTIDRFGALSKEGLLEQERMVHNRAVFPIIKEYPVLGTGLGTFEHVYPRYQPAQARGYRRELHNDWLQLMVETGIVGFLTVFVGFIALMKGFVTLWWKRRDPFAVGIGIGCIGALVAAAIHSLFDFSLHIPASALTLAAVTAIGFLALHSKSHRHRTPFSYRVKKWKRVSW
ncbi:MAG: O-antigen ligase family protein [Thermodesulfobacteriota bacterium]|nr:O-antigen ligase family protein [Thermodesulfobacteriota bacterium]